MKELAWEKLCDKQKPEPDCQKKKKGIS